MASLIVFLATIGAIVGFSIFRHKKYKEGVAAGKSYNHRGLKTTGWCLLIAFISFIGISISVGTDTDDTASSAKTEHVEHKQSSKPKKVTDKKKDNAKKVSTPSKKDDSKKSSKQSSNKIDKKAQKKANLKKLKDKLADLPHDLDGVVDSAEIENGQDVSITVTDDVLASNDSQLKAICKKLWDIGTTLVYKNGPYPSNTLDQDMPSVYIYDTAGDTLAETSMFGTFKYKGAE